MKSYDSVFDYLWLSEVDRAMFDRQIDLIAKDFAPVAQRYLKHVAKVNGLEDDLCWLEVDLDSILNPEVTIDDAYDLVMKSVEQHRTRILSGSCSLSRRTWVDFANSGKDSGGYTADPYRVHPYAHELDRPFKRCLYLDSWDRAFWSIYLFDNHQSC